MSARIDPRKLSRVRVLHEDDDLLVVEKPANLAVHGGAGGDRTNLLDILESAYAPLQKLHLLHRLDKATSGIVAIGKSKEVARQASEAWDRAEKKYLALAFGSIDRALDMDDPVEHRGAERAARTFLTPIARIEAPIPTTLVVVRLGSGRNHQIRQHLAQAGHPVVGDDQHGDFRKNKELVRGLKALGAKASRDTLWLHAARLRLESPHAVTVSSFPPWIETLRNLSPDVSSTPDVISRSLG